jgi:hypothetical protein
MHVAASRLDGQLRARVHARTPWHQIRRGLFGFQMGHYRLDEVGGIGIGRIRDHCLMPSFPA